MKLDTANFLASFSPLGTSGSCSRVASSLPSWNYWFAGPVISSFRSLSPNTPNTFSTRQGRSTLLRTAFTGQLWRLCISALWALGLWLHGCGPGQVLTRPQNICQIGLAHALHASRQGSALPTVSFFSWCQRDNPTMWMWTWWAPNLPSMGSLNFTYIDRTTRWPKVVPLSSTSAATFWFSVKGH